MLNLGLANLRRSSKPRPSSRKKLGRLAIEAVTASTTDPYSLLNSSSSSFQALSPVNHWLAEFIGSDQRSLYTFFRFSSFLAIMATSKPFQGLTFYVPIGSSLKKATKQLQSLIGGHGGALSGSFNDNVRFSFFQRTGAICPNFSIFKRLKYNVDIQQSPF